MYAYTAAQWVLIFFCYCFLGWCFESTYVSFQQHHFVNRGFIRGPLLPLYGCGAIIILWVALPLGRNFLGVFFAGMTAATLLEYGTGVAMEALFKVKYWDYSSHRFQFQGRICLQSSIAWGVLSILLTEVIHPPIADFILALPTLLTQISAIMLSCIFAADLGYAFRTALDFANMLEELTRLRKQADALREELSAVAVEVHEKLEDAREKLTDAAFDTNTHLHFAAAEIRDQYEHNKNAAKLQLIQTLQQRQEKLQKALKETTAAYENHLSKIPRAHRWLVRGNPSAVSAKWDEALRELKTRFDNRHMSKH